MGPHGSTSDVLIHVVILWAEKPVYSCLQDAVAEGQSGSGAGGVMMGQAGCIGSHRLLLQAAAAVKWTKWATDWDRANS